ncbi:uncharacterized protein [Dysidea avara]|uniref:uncharacterized protein n=1 Tax=Dysidea avara TaxID=196820 RepID=UPI0033315DD4
MVSTAFEDADESTNPVPCAGGLDSEPSSGSTSPDNAGPTTLSRMAYLGKGYSMQGFSQRVTNMLLQSWRSHTHSAYNSAWKKWCCWCVRRQADPLSASLADILEFLTDNFELGLQYRTLNTLRSAISMTHARLDNCTVGTHPMVTRLLKGMFNARPPVPRYSHSWEVMPIIDFLRGSSDQLSLLQLSKKVVTLMALCNADRCSDLAALDRHYMRWTSSSVQFSVVQLTKTRRSGPPRTVSFALLQDDNDICPVTNLCRYIEMTSPQVDTMSSPKPVFVTSKKPFRRERSATIGHWIKDTLKAAEVDTERFTVHSTRGASTSCAMAKGVPIAEILKVANWSSSSTFERFYH